jgi:hypothetical protein
VERRLFRLLKETYYGTSRQSAWDPALERTVHGRPGRISEEDWAWLQSSARPPDAVEAWTHDAWVDRIRAVAARVEWRPVLDGFLAACAGTWPRGRQTPISLAYAQHLPDHRFEPGGDGTVCAICGLPQRATFDRTEEVFRLHWGYAWNEQPAHFLADLEEWSELDRPAQRAEDARAFVALLEAIDRAPPDEPPSALEKRLRAAKLPCRVDKYRRYGILLALGELGILPNERIPPSVDGFVTWSSRRAAAAGAGGSHRSDVVLPLSGWRGDLGVDWGRTAALYPGLRGG